MRGVSRVSQAVPELVGDDREGLTADSGQFDWWHH